MVSSIIGTTPRKFMKKKRNPGCPEYDTQGTFPTSKKGQIIIIFVWSIVVNLSTIIPQGDVFVSIACCRNYFIILVFNVDSNWTMHAIPSSWASGASWVKNVLFQISENKAYSILWKMHGRIDGGFCEKKKCSQKSTEKTFRLIFREWSNVMGQKLEGQLA